MVAAIPTEIDRTTPIPAELADVCTIVVALRSALLYSSDAAAVLATWFAQAYPAEASAYAASLRTV